MFSSRDYIALEENRSQSENGLYISFVKRAVKTPKVFAKFKRHPSYRSVLEHVGEADGYRYIDIISNQTPEILQIISKFKENDTLGSPIVFNFKNLGHFSPTTLRYIKVASDLKKYFGENVGKNVVEIGIGYGGQLLVNDGIFNIQKYTLFDLPPVLELTSKYLESFILNCGYSLSTLNQDSGTNSYDLAISNYAFSELPINLQVKYVSKVLSRARRGYLTMNTGMGGEDLDRKYLSIEALRELLPPFDVLEENPKSNPNNYIIIWGHKTLN